MQKLRYSLVGLISCICCAGSFVLASDNPNGRWESEGSYEEIATLCAMALESSQHPEGLSTAEAANAEMLAGRFLKIAASANGVTEKKMMRKLKRLGRQSLPLSLAEFREERDYCLADAAEFEELKSVLE